VAIHILSLSRKSNKDCFSAFQTAKLSLNFIRHVWLNDFKEILFDYRKAVGLSIFISVQLKMFEVPVDILLIPCKDLTRKREMLANICIKSCHIAIKTKKWSLLKSSVQSLWDNYAEEYQHR
jgi:hypothetical protein